MHDFSSFFPSFFPVLTYSCVAALCCSSTDCSLSPCSGILFSLSASLGGTRIHRYVLLSLSLSLYRFPFFCFSTSPQTSQVLSLCHALTFFSSVFYLSLFRPLHLSASPASTSSSDLLSDRSTSGTVLLSRCFLFPVNKGSGRGKEKERERELDQRSARRWNRDDDGEGKHGGNWRAKSREELLEKKINRDSCQPKKFDYVGSADATLG